MLLQIWFTQKEDELLLQKLIAYVKQNYTWYMENH